RPHVPVRSERRRPQRSRPDRVPENSIPAQRGIAAVIPVPGRGNSTVPHRSSPAVALQQFANEPTLPWGEHPTPVAAAAVTNVVSMETSLHVVGHIAKSGHSPAWIVPDRRRPLLQILEGHFVVYAGDLLGVERHAEIVSDLPNGPLWRPPEPVI